MLPQATKTPGELRYRLSCIDKLGYRFRGDERLLDSGCGDGGVARLLRERVGEVQDAVEELLERVPLASRLVSYNYAVATTA